MAENLGIGKNSKFGEIDLSKLKSGLKIEDIAGNNEFFKSIFNKFDTENNDGVLSRSELNNLIQTFKNLAGEDSELSVKEAKGFQLKDGEKLGRKEAKQVFEFLNKLAEATKDVQSVEVNGNVETVTLENGDIEQLFENGNKKTIHKGGSYELRDAQDNLLEEMIKNADSETLTEYADGKKTKETVTTKDNITEVFFTDDENQTKVVRNLQSGVVETFVNNTIKRIEDEKNRSTTTFDDNGYSTTRNLIGDAVEEIVKDDKGTMLSKTHIQKVMNGVIQVTETLYDGENTTTNLSLDGQNISQTKVVDGQKYTAKYDGKGNTYVIVQNGESIAMLAKTFGCTEQEIMDANPGAFKKGPDGPFFKVGQQIVIPGELEADHAGLQGRLGAEEAIGQYDAAMKAKAAREAEEARKAQEAEEAARAQEAAKAEQKTTRGTSLTSKDVTFVRGEDGKVTYLDKDGKEITGAEREKLVKAEIEKLYQDLKDNALFISGTKEEGLAKAIGNIYSAEILNGLSAKLPERFKKDPNCSPMEKFLLDELSHKEARAHIKTLRNNQVLNDTDMVRNFIRELKYEVEGGTGYTGTDELKDVMSLINTPEARELAEAELKKAKSKLIANEGSYVRAYLLQDGWSKEEVDIFDAIWIKNNSYRQAENKRDASGNVVDIDLKDQVHRNQVIKRLAFEHKSEEALQVALDSIDTSGNFDEAGANTDYNYLMLLCKEQNKKAQINDQDPIQAYIAYRSAQEETEPSSITAQHIAYNDLLFNKEKPVKIQVEEMIAQIKNGDYEKFFANTNSKVRAEVAKRLQAGEVSGIKTVEELYKKAQSGKALNIGLKAEALISGEIKFNDAEIIKLCIDLMHDADKYNGYGSTSGFSAKGYNIAQERKLQIETILLKYPNLVGKIKEQANNEKFYYQFTTSDGATIEVQTKQDHLAMLEKTDKIVNEAQFLDQEGKPVTDQEIIKLQTELNKASLNDFREYVNQLEREFKKQVATEGGLSNAANSLSEYTGLGTDRGDVANEYREAKMLLMKLEAAAEGKLRDSQGKVISVQEFAQQFIDKANSLGQTNADYNQTIAIGKMAIKLAPVIAVTMIAAPIASAGAAALGLTGTAAQVATATTMGVAAGGASYGMDAIERNTSLTGNTFEARERAGEDAIVMAILSALPAGVGFKTTEMSAKATSLIARAQAAGIDVSTVAFTSAAADFLQNGTVNEDAFITNCIVAGLASGTVHLMNKAPRTTGNQGANNSGKKLPTLEPDDLPVGRTPFYEGGSVPNSHIRTLDGGTPQSFEGNILSNATRNGTASSGGAFGDDVFMDVLHQTDDIARNGTADDVARVYRHSRRHTTASHHQARTVKMRLYDANDIVEIGKKRFNIAEATADDLVTIRKYANGLSDTERKNKILAAVSVRQKQLNVRTAEMPIPTANQASNFDDLFNKSSFGGEILPHKPIDRLSTREVLVRMEELKKLCAAATDESQLNKLSQRAAMHRSDPQREAFNKLIEARRVELKKAPTSNPVAETPVTSLEVGVQSRTTQVIESMNRTDAEMAAEILRQPKGRGITPTERTTLEFHLTNNLNTKEQIDDFITQLKNRVGTNEKGQMHVYKTGEVDHAALVLQQAERKLATIKASDDVFTAINTAKTAGRGLNENELKAIKTFVNNSDSNDDLQKVLNSLKELSKKNDQVKKLIREIEARLQTRGGG